MREKDILTLNVGANDNTGTQGASGEAGMTSSDGSAKKKSTSSRSRKERRNREPNKIRVEVVERGVPKKKWFLIKWMVEEDKAGEEDSIVLFSEDIKQSVEVWSLNLLHQKHRGSTHCIVASSVNIGRFFASYVKKDGTILCRSPTVLIGPKVLLKSEVKGSSLFCQFRIDKADQSSWDWIGLFHSTQEENYTNYVTWNYIDMSKDIVTLDAPVTPGDYVCCYFSSSKKYTPVAFSNFINIPDINSLSVTGGPFEPGGRISVGLNISSHPRDPRDWIGLYISHQYKKHMYLACIECARNLSVVELEIPEENEAFKNLDLKFCIRYVSISAAPLTGGAIITSSKPFDVKK